MSTTPRPANLTGTNPTETVATFTRVGETYEIDHLGIGNPNQWGEFAVYTDGIQVAEFAIPAAMLRAELRPDDIPSADELIVLARAAVAQNDAS